MEVPANLKRAAAPWAGLKTVATAVRSHWSVENALYWSLDVGFREDACQVRKDNAPANLACLRRMALTQLKQEAGKKLGIQGKRSRAGWGSEYLETVLRMGGFRCDSPACETRLPPTLPTCV